MSSTDRLVYTLLCAAAALTFGSGCRGNQPILVSGSFVAERPARTAPLLGINVNLAYDAVFFVFEDGVEERLVEAIDPEGWPSHCTDKKKKGIAEDAVDVMLEHPDFDLEPLEVAGVELVAPVLSARCDADGLRLRDGAEEWLFVPFEGSAAEEP